MQSGVSRCFTWLHHDIQLFFVKNPTRRMNASIVSKRNGLFVPDNDKPGDLAYRHHLYIIGYSIFGILAIIGNAFVIHVIRKTRHMHRLSNYIICSLASVDILTGCIMILNATSYMFARTNIFIKITAIIREMFTFVSLNHIFFLSMDRYIAVSRPYFYQSHSERKAVVTAYIILPWLFILPSACMYHLIPKTTLFACPNSPFGDYLLTEFIGFTIMFVEVFVTVLFHVLIFLTARSHQIRIQTEIRTMHSQQKSRLKFEMKAAKTTIIVVGAYISFISPLLVFYVSDIFCAGWTDYYLSFDIAWFVVLCNSSVNPVVYTLRQNEYKIAAKHIFCRTTR
ncbi:trace amine-associated receptor 8b-like [Anneissia japonica]|uniref:trace amine-associated receptor 8b-like n=1 Tax=Anneissia japonica TaxID=1529436 RepID=UPI00142597A0|nr:trace amine-associated receptor 8b-like [Anneissia japonica]